ncbi:antibiotic biosynthesis monooxygenase [Enterovibrio norvegicus FF-33]|uniref:Antibiotic biosynthesis monooxygenase n=1 Tax=Enterovibrio norvegicus FF-454 TaxID=1185651 RepID=A0A1E5C4H3_9GAMM|nr:antibiotic biosynthesis monooxygenase [Enterovibrio norvegicus]OEE60347.1 antibiotic biosynthesis monooxygenase [Enterovibrio norvegicus FF-454]OEE70252.1 antibiotic biosynthesis monooxygenase [Enterovibrio norvegicus FF-33]OEE88851.1 antibiotic biosynthesis monooxygenase [Enterovibrio norvegicus FF-162]
MSVRVTLNCNVKAGQHETLLPFLDKNLPNVRGFDGCLSVDVYFDEKGEEMLLEEEWLSIEKHQAYIGYIQQNGVLGELAAFFSSAPVIKYFHKESV